LKELESKKKNFFFSKRISSLKTFSLGKIDSLFLVS
jgi:hypothetical protein